MLLRHPLTIVELYHTHAWCYVLWNVKGPFWTFFMRKFPPCWFKYYLLIHHGQWDNVHIACCTHCQLSVGLNYLSIPKFQRCSRWSLRMDNYFNPTLYNGCHYLSMRGLQLNHVSKRGPRCSPVRLRLRQCLFNQNRYRYHIRSTKNITIYNNHIFLIYNESNARGETSIKVISDRWHGGHPKRNK